MATDSDQVGAAETLDYDGTEPMSNQAFGRSAAYGTSNFNEATGRGYWASSAHTWPSVVLAWQSGDGTLVVGTNGNFGADDGTQWRTQTPKGTYTADNGRTGNWWSVRHVDGSENDPLSLDVFFSIVPASS